MGEAVADRPPGRQRTLQLEYQFDRLGAEKLAQAKINIKCAYATTGAGGSATVVLVVANPDKAQALLGG